VVGHLAPLWRGLVEQADITMDGPEAIGGDASAGDEDDDNEVAKVPIATRAQPLIELLEAAVNSSDNVMWDS